MTKIFPGLSLDQQTPILRELANRPSFGQYEPLHEVTRQTPKDTDPSLAVDSLVGHMQLSAVQSLMLQRIGDPQTFRRGNYSFRYLSDLPLTQVKMHAEAWLAEPD